MVPTEYEIQRLAIQRGLMSGDKFERIETGVLGENIFFQYLQEFGLKHWVILKNVWFNDDRDFECDFILITRHQVYLFEVKNYYGKFVYKNGRSYSRGYAIPYNPINQARNATINLKNITGKYSRSITVHASLVFIGKHNEVHIHDEVDDLRILETNEVYQFIQDIIQEERQYRGTWIDANKLVDYYSGLVIQNPHLTKPFTITEMTQAEGGIFCTKCQKKVVMTRGNYIHCDCGFSESREEAIVRTACEYGVLTYGRNFTVSDIRKFIGYQATYDYLRIVLSKHFKIVSDQKVLTFANPDSDFSNLSHSFKFKYPKTQVLS